MSHGEPRAILRRVMEEQGLNPHALAQRANIRPSTLYNFLSGVSETLSLPVIEKIAAVTGIGMDALLGKAPLAGGAIPVAWEVGILGRLYPDDRNLTLTRPPGLDPAEDVVAAITNDEVLRPMPGEWNVLFRKEPEEPDGLLGQLCVVRVAGHSQPMIREIRRGSRRGLYTLSFWAASPMEDVEVLAAHRIVSLNQRAPGTSP